MSLEQYMWDILQSQQERIAGLEKVGEYTYVMDKIRTLTVENKLLKEHITELEATLKSVNECFGELYVKKQIKKLKEQGE